MTVGTANFPELLWPGIAKIFQDSYDDFDPIFSRFYATMTGNKAFEKVQGVVGLPLASVKQQGSPINYLDPLQGYQKEFVQVVYALGSSVTKEMYTDDQYNVINRIPRYLARSMRHTKEVVHHAILNLGFTTALSADGVSLFNTAHPQIGGAASQSNMGQSGVTYALSQTSLEAAMIEIQRWTDDRGLRINVRPIQLIVPPELSFVADKILQTEYEVGTGNNTINPVRGRLEMINSPFLTDPDAWFITTSVNQQDENGLMSFQHEAWPIELARDNEFDTKNLKMTATERYVPGASDFRGLWGSTGA